MSLLEQAKSRRKRTIIDVPPWGKLVVRELGARTAMKAAFNTEKDSLSDEEKLLENWRFFLLNCVENEAGEKEFKTVAEVDEFLENGDLPAVSELMIEIHKARTAQLNQELTGTPGESGI